MGFSGYDSLVDSLIPGYSSLARLSVSLLAASPLARARDASVLVAGCGSGAELLEARRLCPAWSLTALDPSPTMLAIARQKVQDQGDSAAPIRWIEGNVEDLPAQAVFDGAMAVLVLQGLPDDGSKLRFLTSLSRSLRAGAQVVLVDQMQPERNGIERQLIDARQLFQRTDGGVEILGGVYPITMARLTGLLEASGFSDPLSVFRALDFEGFLLQRLP
jgi:tRNA (cmo5U34)-methyltransferase